MLKNTIDPDNIPSWLQSFWERSNYDNVIAGINDDDCAVISINKEDSIIITTDFLNANPISVELGICGTYDLGRLIVASNISDLCGTGAKPIAFLLGVTMAHADTEDQLFDLFKGVKAELLKYSIPLVGGDTKLGKSRSFIGTAIGYTNSKRKLFLKNSAKPNDIIWVSGDLGAVSSSVLGLSINIMDENWIKNAKQTILSPQVPLNKSEIVALSMFGNGGTDISDGLGADLNNLLDSSNVGAEIHSNLIPYNALVSDIAGKLHVEPWFFSFIIGGDFQFLVTTSPEYKQQMCANGFIEIGQITEQREKWLILKNKKVILPDFGHRDGRNLTFTEEVNDLLNKLKYLIYGND